MASPTSEKARKILRDGKIQGKTLTSDQRKFFQARANRKNNKRITQMRGSK